ncbi:thiamine pyrophosphate-dependent dehydrogenase E1 component subunit alpha [Parafrankia sp. EUN1f]|uniref:thiamine pyrophosphate-dependent dehydrogenase E1 component subunit alpha n=1 Tax=Parafrankia sp. EUN1f TaxID=102897 RepID=UPI0001C44232|nr:thiamine pyrophosphate-dependent dehydrogenase E1 component subunit alpha [Parafrankia sp. EUN1f]EFC85794.1 Pyruvate dehydrogenase (acetyl-transferring) [Parafrankia sp. EUN1f]
MLIAPFQPAELTRQGRLVHIYRTVVTIRFAELRIRDYVETEGFGGFWHPGIGQEGLQAGAIAAMDPDDYLYYAHRGLGYAYAKGMPLAALFGDLLGRVTGSTRGKGGGTVHFASAEKRVLGQGGTLGSNFVLGAGTALASQLLGDGRVTVVFFGDGASGRGTWHEAALQASVWKLPVVWVCENNGWALSARFEEQSPTPNIADRASAYGMPGVIVDGQDAIAVMDATTEAIERARRGDGPTLIEAKTLRIRGHYEGDRQPYREDRVKDDEIPNDPVHRLGELLPDDERRDIDTDARRRVAEAFDEALAAPRPETTVIYEDVWA